MTSPSLLVREHADSGRSAGLGPARLWYSIKGQRIAVAWLSLLVSSFSCGGVRRVGSRYGTTYLIRPTASLPSLGSDWPKLWWTNMCYILCGHMQSSDALLISTIKLLPEAAPWMIDSSRLGISYRWGRCAALMMGVGCLGWNEYFAACRLGIF